MKHLKNLIVNITIGLNALLIFLLCVEQRLVIPGWLQVGGRIHPLVLHFPIVLILAVAGYASYMQLIRKQPLLQNGFDKAVLMAAFFAGLTALSGFLLSREQGYDTDNIAFHKWSGTTLSVILLVWYLMYAQIQRLRWGAGVIGLASMAGTVMAGHLGAAITHGENFLLQPVLKNQEAPAVAFENAVVFANMVQPILQAKCMACHSNSKAKGNLVMETPAALLKGGKSGALWNAGLPGFGLLMDRVHLQMDARKHMPPVGKPQLTEEEILILEQWIRQGADFTVRVAALPANDTLQKIAKQKFGHAENEHFSFSAADAATLKKLNTENRIVNPIAQQSPALTAEFYGRSLYQSQQLKDLLAVKEQLIALNLNKMPVSDEDLSSIAQCKNLRKLNLSFTDITGKGLLRLSALSGLKQLSVSGTLLNANDLMALKSLPALETVYAWNINLTPAEKTRVAAAFKTTRFEWGFFGDTVILKLNMPIIENLEQIITSPITLKLKHFMPGTEMRYTLDGTDPDSLHSPVFKPGIIISNQGLLKARAFKKGWMASDMVEMFFYKNRYRPDSIVGLLPPDNAYKGNGATTLTDNVKGDLVFRSGKWLGFKDNNLEVLLSFKQPTPISKVTLSGIVDIGNYIMPPASIEVWGGQSANQLTRLKVLKPEQPVKDAMGYLQWYNIDLTPQPLKFIKVIAKPVFPLPAWHRGKGDKGWVFADEIFFN